MKRPDLDRPDALRAAGRATAELDAALVAIPAAEAPFDWLGPDLRRAALDRELITALATAGLPEQQVACGCRITPGVRSAPRTCRPR